VVVQFEGDKMVHEHLYWDQASVLAQLSILDPADLPVKGCRESARRLLEWSRTKNPA